MCHKTGDKSVTMCGIAQEEASKDDPAYTKPWHVTVKKVTTEHFNHEEGYDFLLDSLAWVFTEEHYFPLL